MSQLAGIVYFDFNMTDVFGRKLEPGNWQIETDPAALIAYGALGSDPRFQGTLGEPAGAPTPSVPAPVGSPSPSSSPVPSPTS